MPTITIDGKQITVEEGTTIIEAARRLDQSIPHYCYHRGLSIAGNCRICLVEIEKFHKLQIACNTPAAEGMVVHTDNHRVKTAQQEVLEFLLANHPLDCPVCDQSGECKLQNYYMSYGQYDSRFLEQKVKKPKAVSIGPTIMLDAERCILCSRCVRFTDEISKTHEFGIFNRGDHAEIGLYPGKELDNPYSGNVADICPVGALTDKDFRFKCRVWYLEEQESVCPGCSQGCNIEIHYQLKRKHIADGDRVMRLKPRHNPDVNQFWMCDEGRYGYPMIDQNRLEAPRLNRAPVEWPMALEATANALKDAQAQGGGRGIAVLASSHSTNEELFALKKIFKDFMSVPHIDVRLPYKPGSADDFLMKADKSPNMRGAMEIGLVPDRTGLSASQIVDEAKKGVIKVLYVVQHNLLDLYAPEQVKALFENVPCVIFQGAHDHGFAKYAHIVLPSAVYAEKDGTFTNVHGRVQRIRPAFPPLGQARLDLDILKALGIQLGFQWPWAHVAAIMQDLAAQVPAFQGMTYEAIGNQGKLLASVSQSSIVTRHSSMV